MLASKKIKVLVVDDSFFMKKLLRELLETDSKITVVGVAKDGDDAILKVQELEPDVITMDYNMPGKNGMETIEAILALNLARKPAIIMVSAYTSPGSGVALDCLRAGAVDFILKPSGELSLDIDKIKDELIEKVHIAYLARIKSYSPSKFITTKNSDSEVALSDKVVVIGSSTGGPPLVEDILGALPKDFPATVIVVQHMPKFFTERFAERLNKITPLEVVEAQDGDVMLTKKIYIMPANFDFTVTPSKKIKLIEDKTCKGPQPCINDAMASLVDIYEDKIIGVILTGMGEDGLEGAIKIRKAGGTMIAQDPNTAVISSMPDAVVLAGLANKVLPPEKIAQYLIDNI